MTERLPTRHVTARPPFVRVEHVMGTAVSVHVREGDLDAADLGPAFAYLREVDARFSTYRPDSEISRLGRGELHEEDCSQDVRQVLAVCDDLYRTSDGYFDARGYRPGRTPDPTALVKGWSVEEAAWMLQESGARRFAINAGGDVVVRGGIAPGRPWRVGIRHPGRADRLAAVLLISDGAVATSGAYERGGHVLDPHTGAPPCELASLSVVGPSLTYADAYATAAFAMGVEGLLWVAARPGYGAYGITSDGRALWTPEMERWLEPRPDGAREAARSSGLFQGRAVHHAAGMRRAS
jgi:FAD:protein FMN transferase